MRIGDFHLHTRASDGAHSPSEVVRLAVDAGLTWISITDHDTMGAYAEAIPAAEAAGIGLTYGVELSTSLNRKDCHLLVYGMAPDHPVMRETLESQKSIRYTRIKALLALLNERGVDIDIQDVAASAGHLTLGRVHVAQAMVDAGVVPTMRAAFDMHLSAVARKTPSPFPTTQEIIARFKDAGAVTVLAHPGHLYSFLDLRELVSAGLQGIEVVHPSHDQSLRAKYIEYARICGLVVSGGSDFHGTKPDDRTLMGVVALHETESLTFLEHIDHVCDIHG
jgi:predicted metal-dependent phosphoesterase TrpH